MHILAIETTGKYCSVALGKGKDFLEEIWEEKSMEPMNHLKNLTPMISKVIKKADISLGDIDLIAVSDGPGSFTGIRIGVSTARVLSQALEKPVVSINTIEALARRYRSDKIMVSPIFDARRQQIYGGGFLGNKNIVDIKPWNIQEFLLSITKNMCEIREALFLGDGVKPYKETIEKWTFERRIKTIFKDEFQDAKEVLELAFEKKTDGIFREYNNVHPNYMRKPEAQRNLEEKWKKLGLKDGQKTTF